MEQLPKFIDEACFPEQGLIRGIQVQQICQQTEAVLNDDTALSESSIKTNEIEDTIERILKGDYLLKLSRS